MTTSRVSSSHRYYTALGIAILLVSLSMALLWNKSAQAEPNGSITAILIQASGAEQTQNVSFLIEGSIVVGETFRIFLEGNLYQYAVQEDDSAIDVATQLGGIVGSDVSCNGVGDTIVCLGSSNNTPYQYSAYVIQGIGQVEDPYIITSCGQLQDIDYELDAHYKLGGDIDCAVTEMWNPNEGEWVDGVVGGELIPDLYNDFYVDRVADVINNGYFGFRPIGSPDSPFVGTLDGNGKTISDLWIFRKDADDNDDASRNEDIGLFSYLDDGAEVHDLSLLNASVVGWNYVGGVVGTLADATLLYVTVEDSMVRAYLGIGGGGLAGRMEYGEDPTISLSHVIGGTVHGSGIVIGGLVGSMTAGSIADSTTSADVDGGESVGGAIGSITGGSVSNVHAYGNVVGDYWAEFGKYGGSVGGFAGYISGEDILITNSSASGDVTADGVNVGGFIGYMDVATHVYESYATGDVFGAGAVGGFVGINFGTIENAYATGAVTGAGSTIGGFVGANEGDISFAYSTSDVSGMGEEGSFYNVGGFVGDNINGGGGSINHVFSVGSVTVTEDYGQVGRFVGYNGSTITSSGYYTGGEGAEQEEIEGLIYVEDNANVFKSSFYVFYEEWDFEVIWTTVGGTVYPIFQWQEYEPVDETIIPSENAIYEMVRKALGDADNIWTSVSVSSDGQKMVAVGASQLGGLGGLIYISTDAGQNWELSHAIEDVFLTSVVSSADGMKIYAIGLTSQLDDESGFAFAMVRSLDGGETWQEEINSTSEGDWEFGFEEFMMLLLSRITGSADLSHLYINFFGMLIHSVDGGENWNLVLDTLETGGFITSVSTSADGSKIMVSASTLLDFGAEVNAYYISSNFGVDWETYPVGEGLWPFSTAMSPDGTRLFLTGVNEEMYFSLDGGETWSTSTNPDGYGWMYVAPSATGQGIVASALGYGDGVDILAVYASLDNGATWAKQAETTIASGDFFESFFGIVTGRISGASDLSSIGLATLARLYTLTKIETVLPTPTPSPTDSVRRSRSGGGGSTFTPTLSLVDQIRSQLASLLAQYKLLTGRDFGQTDSNLPVRDLRVGMNGDDVKALQNLLISQGYPIPAGPTGYFANQTRYALASYQSANNISPSVGYFGSITRAFMKVANLIGLWW